MEAGRLHGKGIGFPPRIGADGRWVWSEGEDNVRESIRILLTTEQGERTMLPRLGGGLASFLFEPNTVATRHQIGERISRVLAQWEPRVSVESVTVDADPSDLRAAIATIRYKLVATQALGQLSLGVQLSG